MKKSSLFAALFVISLALFFVGAVTGNIPVALFGMAVTLVLYLTRRAFLPK